MKRSAAVIGTKKKELPILVTESVPHEGLDTCLGAGVLVTRNPGPHPSRETPWSSVRFRRCQCRQTLNG